MIEKGEKVRKQRREEQTDIKDKNTASLPSPFLTEKHFISEEI